MSKKVLPENLMNSVLGYLYDTLCTGDDVAPKSEDNYLSWCTPGIPMMKEDFDYMSEGLMGVRKADSEPPESDEEESSDQDINRELSQNVAGKYQAAENFSRICDMIPDTSGVQGDVTMNTWNVENTLSHAYEQVLRFSQVADFGIDDETKKKVERLRGLLQEKKIKKDLITDEETEVIEESPLVKKYNEKKQEYISTVLEYNTHRVNALAGQDPAAVHYWSLNAPVLRNKVQGAMNDWVTNGYKNEYERIAAFIRQVESRSMALLKAQYIDDLEKSKLGGISSGSNFIYTTLVPGSFAESAGWTQFNFSKNEFNSKYSYDKKKGSGRVGLSLGVFNIGGGGGYEKKERHSEIDVSNFRLTFKMAQVPIVRPGININFLTSNYWRFVQNNPEFNEQMVSDGKTPPNGMIPAIPTTCIFVKDLYLHFGESHRIMDEVKEVKSGGGALSWGPFAIGGKYKHESFDRDTESNSESQGIRIPGMQLIGFKCHMMPKSPNPHPDIEEDAWI